MSAGLLTAIHSFTKWSLENTPVTSEYQPAPVVSGLLGAGRSDARLTLAVVKTGGVGEMYEQVRHMERLRTVAPPILAEWPGGYATAYVADRHRADVLMIARSVLEREVWPHQSVVEASGWLAEFVERFGREPPDWVLHEFMCLTHGDPTLANILVDSERLYLIDPKVPGRRGIPPFRSADLACMLVSMAGWEQAVSGVNRGAMFSPLLGLDSVALLRVVYWCARGLERIEQREARDGGSARLLEWARVRRSRLEDMMQGELAT